MTKYKINRDQSKKPDVLSKKQVDGFKNFNELKANYDKNTKRPKKPLYKDRRFFLGLLIVVIIAYLLSMID